MYIIVGSTALEYFNLNRSAPKDKDVWYSKDDRSFACGERQDKVIMSDNILKLIPTEKSYATPDAVYTIKCSHLGWENPMWDKHKADVIWLKSKGCKLITELYKALLEHWKTELGDKNFLSLDKSKEQFFTDKVNYVYEHDYLHELVAYPNKPVYTTILQGDNEVLLDKSKFDKLSFNMQVRLFREEISVIACERWCCNPYWYGKISWYKAYQLSLRKTITNLTKGWATNFIVENLEKFIKPDFSYFKYLLITLDNGRYSMSKVDVEVFEDFKEKIGDTDSLECLVYKMCEGDIYFGGDYIFENEYPSYKLEKTNPEEYTRLKDLFFKERNDRYEPYIEALQLSSGYEHLDQDGGGEGGSEDCYGVFKLNGVIYKAEYNYYSHHGHEYGDILETLRVVTPVEKTITVYE